MTNKRVTGVTCADCGLQLGQTKNCPACQLEEKIKDMESPIEAEPSDAMLSAVRLLVLPYLDRMARQGEDNIWRPAKRIGDALREIPDARPTTAEPSEAVEKASRKSTVVSILLDYYGSIGNNANEAANDIIAALRTAAPNDALVEALREWHSHARTPAAEQAFREGFNYARCFALSESAQEIDTNVEEECWRESLTRLAMQFACPPEAEPSETVELAWVDWCPYSVVQARLCNGDIIDGPLFDLNLTGKDKPTTIVALRLQATRTAPPNDEHTPIAASVKVKVVKRKPFVIEDDAPNDALVEALDTTHKLISEFAFSGFVDPDVGERLFLNQDKIATALKTVRPDEGKE